MTQYTVIVFPDVGEMFGNNAFDKVVGGTVLFTSPVTGNKGYGILKGVEVEEHGSFATLTIEFEEPRINGHAFR